jgi:hypothetical protein
MVSNPLPTRSSCHPFEEDLMPVDTRRTWTVTAERRDPVDEGPSYRDLYEEAKRKDLPGRSRMSKTELERALGR